MKSTPFTKILAFLAAALVSAILARSEGAAAPQLKFDRSEVSKGMKPGLVASYADMIDPVEPSVVSVYSTTIVRNPDAAEPLLRKYFGDSIPKEDKQQGLGSGVIVSSDGYILTNNHVVDGADELEVQLSGEQKYPATVVGGDPKTDIAVIKIEAKDLPTVTFADSDKLRVGDVVFALGNPLGVGQTVTMGIVSAVGRSQLDLLDGAGYENFIQTDAAINMGNSGGALVDARGRLVGINTAILSPSRGSIGIGFAIPANMAAAIMSNLIENHGVVKRGMLGISGETLSPELAEALKLPKETRGVVIQQLRPEDGPAAKAGLEIEDVILSINARPTHTLEDLRVLVAPMEPGSKVAVRLLRDGQEKTFEVTLGLFDGDNAGSDLLPGVSVVPLTADLRRRFEIDAGVDGLVVTEVDARSLYKDVLIPGVVILSVNRVPATTVKRAKDAMVKGPNRFLVNYRGNNRILPITPP